MPEESTAPPIMFVAYCVTCPEWEGQERANEIVALRDLDRHQGGIDHVNAFAEMAYRDTNAPASHDPIEAVHA